MAEDQEKKEVGAAGALTVPGVNLPAERMKSAKGVNQIDSEDRIIPRIVIGQPGSPEVIAATHTLGDLYTQFQNYGKTVIFVPITWWKSRINWAPRDQGSEILCRANNAMDGDVYGKCADCQFSKWTKDAPICTAVINMVVLMPDKIPVALSFMKTSYKTGKQLINLFNYKKVDIFNFSYELLTEKIEKDGNTYCVIKYNDQNLPVSDDMYKLCNGIFEQFKIMGGKDRVQDVGGEQQPT